MTATLDSSEAGTGAYASEGNSLGRILLVDDEDAILHTFTRYLTKHGYQVSPARSGKEAWDIIQQYPFFDLIITDLAMPEMSGWELIDQICNEHEIPIIATSGAGLTSGERDPLLDPFLKSGLVSPLPKPFNPKVLLEQAEQLIKENRPNRAS